MSAILRDFMIYGPDLRILKRAEALLRQLGACPDHHELWPSAAIQWISLGQPYERREYIHTFLKQIELYLLEQHHYHGLSETILKRATFYCQLLENPCDRYYEEAMRLERWLAHLIEGPLTVDTTVTPERMTVLRYGHASLCLHLAQIRGDLEEVRIRYEALERIVHPYTAWLTLLEGIRTYTTLGALSRAEQCLADTYLTEPTLPDLFNEMRRMRAKITLRLAQHEVDEARAVLDDEYRPLCEWYRNWPDVRFFVATAERLGLPQIGYENAKIVLMHWLAL
jgi:hypothetical protein